MSIKQIVARSLCGDELRVLETRMRQESVELEARLRQDMTAEFTAEVTALRQEVAALRQEVAGAKAECLKVTAAFSKEVLANIRAQLASHATVLKQSADASTAISRLLHRK